MTAEKWFDIHRPQRGEIVASYALNNSTEDAMAILHDAKHEIVYAVGERHATATDERAYTILNNAVHYLQQEALPSWQSGGRQQMEEIWRNGNRIFRRATCSTWARESTRIRERAAKR